MPQQLSTNTFTTAKWIVSPTASDGTHTTIAGALASASAGDTIFIRPGTYTENPSLVAGVNLTAFGSDSSLNGTGKVIINGNCTMSTAGSVTISGIQLQTNSAALLTVSGSVASIVNLNNCYLNCSNATGISYSSSSASSAINILNCNGDLGTTGIALFSHSSSGGLNFKYSNFSNSGGSSTANTISAGTIDLFASSVKNPITGSSTSGITAKNSNFDSSAQNATALTIGGSGTNAVLNCNIASGTASAISVTATLSIQFSLINSSNAHVITGAGTINFQGLGFSTSTNGINVTTQNTAGTLFGLSGTQAPTSGMIGERISSTVLAGAAVSLSNNVAANITSISVPAGIWDISGVGTITNSGASSLHQLSVNTTSATIGSVGDNAFQDNATTNYSTLSVPVWRQAFTATTTVYLVALDAFSSGAGAAYGRISAVRAA